MLAYRYNKGLSHMWIPFVYEFELYHNAAKAARNINKAFLDGVVKTKCTAVVPKTLIRCIECGTCTTWTSSTIHEKQQNPNISLSDFRQTERDIIRQFTITCVLSVNLKSYIIGFFVNSLDKTSVFDWKFAFLCSEEEKCPVFEQINHV